MPKQFDEGIREDVCKGLMDGKSLVDICNQKGMPSRDTVYDWIKSDASFSDMYARAREIGLDKEADEIRELADNGTNEDAAIIRLRMDARKWRLSKMLPRKYGDRVDLTSSDGSMTPQSLPWAKMYPEKDGDT